MQLVERSALVTYTAAQMFALVNDVARYPEFLPWCVGARVEDVAPASASPPSKWRAAFCGPNSPRATPCGRMSRFT